jgi:hypothetical protein
MNEDTKKILVTPSGVAKFAPFDELDPRHVANIVMTEKTILVFEAHHYLRESQLSQLAEVLESAFGKKRCAILHGGISLRASVELDREAAHE